jgi:hypothetical protein
MKGMRWVVAAGVLVALGVVGASAQSLKVRQRMKDQETALIEYVDHTNKVCDSKISITFNWTGAPEADLDKYSPSGYCDGALGGVRRVCDDPVGKDAVKQKIKSFTCGFGAERSISLKDGAVDYKINFNSANDSDFVFEYLQNNL